MTRGQKSPTERFGSEIFISLAWALISSEAEADAILLFDQGEGEEFLLLFRLLSVFYISSSPQQLNLPILAKKRNVPGGSFIGKNEVLASCFPFVLLLRKILNVIGKDSPSSIFRIAEITLSKELGCISFSIPIPMNSFCGIRLIAVHMLLTPQKKSPLQTAAGKSI